MPRTPLVAVRAALRSADKASGEAGPGRGERTRDTGLRRPQAEAQTAIAARAKARAPINPHSRFVT